jgi:predicted GNAT family acetyltransferase
MVIQQEESGTEGSFYMKEGSELVAEMTYSLPGEDTMIIEHTFVNEDSRGNNIGYDILREAAAYARQKKLSIIPQCSFANAVFTKKPKEFGDVKKKG